MHEIAQQAISTTSWDPDWCGVGLLWWTFSCRFFPITVPWVSNIYFHTNILLLYISTGHLWMTLVFAMKIQPPTLLLSLKLLLMLLLLNPSLIHTLLHTCISIHMVLLHMDHKVLLLHMLLLLHSLPGLVLLHQMVPVLHFILCRHDNATKQPSRCNFKHVHLLWCSSILMVKDWRV